MSLSACCASLQLEYFRVGWTKRSVSIAQHSEIDGSALLDPSYFET